jgi:hypothetical protein
MDGARDAADARESGSEGADGGPEGLDAACELQPATLLADGFDAWEEYPALGCLTPFDLAANAACEDATVTNGSFTINVNVCPGTQWEVHVFDADRGLDCYANRPAILGVFTLTPADCTCAAAGADPSTGCAGADGGADGVANGDADASDGQ